MSKTEEYLELIAALLREQTTLALATAGAKGEPCIAPLFYIADEKLSLYWLSSPESEHSINLAKTPRAAATIYASATNWRGIRGVQLRGTVAAITDPERRRALLKNYRERFKLGTIFRVAIRRSTLYVFQPDFFRLIDNSKIFGSKFELARGPEGWHGVRSENTK